MVDIIPQPGSNQQQDAATEGQVRPSLDHPWVASASTPEEVSATDDRVAGNQEIIDTPRYADLNQPQPPQTEAIPVTTEEVPAEPVAVTDGLAPAVETLNPTPIERQPETTGLSPEQVAKAAQLTEELRIKAEKRRADLNIEAQALEEELQALEELRDSLTKPQ